MNPDHALHAVTALKDNIVRGITLDCSVSHKSQHMIKQPRGLSNSPDSPGDLFARSPFEPAFRNHVHLPPPAGPMPSHGAPYTNPYHRSGPPRAGYEHQGYAMHGYVPAPPRMRQPPVYDNYPPNLMHHPMEQHQGFDERYAYMAPPPRRYADIIPGLLTRVSDGGSSTDMPMSMSSPFSSHSSDSSQYNSLLQNVHRKSPPLYSDLQFLGCE